MNETRFARIITMKAKPGKGREFVKTFGTSVAFSATKLKGLRRLYLLRQVGKKEDFVVLSFWDNEKTAEDYAKSGADKKYATKLSRMQEGKERVKKFHVELHVIGRSIEDREG